MDELRHWLTTVTAALDQIGVRYAVVGGLAVSARSEARFTRDVDLAVAVASDADAERILAYLIRSGFRPLTELNNTRTRRLATMRLLPPGQVPDEETGEAMLVDLIFDSCGIEPEVVAAATSLAVFPNLLLPVASRAHLIAMKLVSVSRRRRKDKTDLESLIEAADDAELAAARRLARLITKRGYHRGRKLVAALDKLIRETRD